MGIRGKKVLGEKVYRGNKVHRGNRIPGFCVSYLCFSAKNPSLKWKKA